MSNNTTRKWDGKSPRAVAPCKELRNAMVPVQCDATHAVRSPLPYGCALFCETDDSIGTQDAVPMFWVSNALARGRGKGVESGWYVLGHVGDNFALHVSNVHPTGGVHINGELVGPDIEACVLLDVDGTNPIGSRGLTIAPGHEAVVNGFAESATYRRNETEGVLSVRRFRFEKAAICSGGDAGGDGGGAGCIRLMIGLGQPLQRRLEAESTLGQLGAPGMVDEVTAMKKGESMRVNRSGAVLSEKLTRANYELKCGCLKGVVKVFIRQRYWLESRNIIDRNGRAWRPSPRMSFDLTGAQDAGEEVDVVDLT